MKKYCNIIISGIASVILFTFPGCRKNSAEEPAPLLMTVHLADHFTYPPFKAVLYISAPDGSVLADTTVTSGGTCYFHMPGSPAATSPATLSLTWAVYELYWHGVKVHISTYTDIKPGSEWALVGTLPDSVGTVTLTLENLPSGSNEILYSTSGFSNLTFNPAGRTAILYQSPDDLYIRIRRTSGDRFKLIEGITAGGNYTVDYSEFGPFAVQAISFPFGAQNWEAGIYGYRQPGFTLQLPFTTDLLISNGTTVPGISVTYPPGVFAGFHSELMIQESYTSPDMYLYRVDGEIPSEFKKIEATILSVQPGQGKVDFGASGTWDMAAAQWIFNSSQFEFFDWTLYGSQAAQKTSKLPAVSPALHRLFPSLAIDSLSLSYLELTDFLTLESYDKFLGKAFDPSFTSSPMHIEAAIVRQTIARGH